MSSPWLGSLVNNLGRNLHCLIIVVQTKFWLNKVVLNSFLALLAYKGASFSLTTLPYEKIVSIFHGNQAPHYLSSSSMETILLAYMHESLKTDRFWLAEFAARKELSVWWDLLIIVLQVLRNQKGLCFWEWNSGRRGWNFIVRLRGGLWNGLWNKKWGRQKSANWLSGMWRMQKAVWPRFDMIAVGTKGTHIRQNGRTLSILKAMHMTLA